MERSQFTIELTPEETVMADAIRFNPLAFQDNHQAFNENADLAHQLVTRLLKRGVIPEQRIRYLTDPEYNPGGRGRSRKQGFERNGTQGDAMLRHPHFLKYLRYFIHGADLPSPILSAFMQAVKNCGSVTSGDIVPLGTTARQLAHSHRLEPKTAADEFYKLCIDLGLSPNVANSIRASLQRLRSVR